MKLSNRAQKMISDANKLYGGYVYVSSGYKTSCKKGYGRGLFATAMKLCKLGILELVCSKSYREVGKYGTDNWTEYTFKLVTK